MWENGSISCAEESEIIYTHIPASRRYNSLLLQVWAPLILPSKEYRIEREERVTLQWRNPKQNRVSVW